MKRLVCTLFALVLSSPALAIECISSNQDARPILVFGQVNSRIGGAEPEVLERRLRERLSAGGKYQVLLDDQYRYAEKTARIDKCTPALLANLTLGGVATDSGAAFGVSGLATKKEFSAHVQIYKLPERVTLDDFELSEVSKSFLVETAGVKAFEKLLDSVAAELERRRDGWVQTKTPGF